MRKSDQTAVTDSGIEVEPTPEEFQVATILLTARMHWNGSTLHAGATIGGIPMAQARQMVEDHGVRIVGTATSATRQRRTGIAHELPAGLSPDFEAVHTVEGQRSSVFINTRELDALRNR
jgi:hypothetical protein